LPNITVAASVFIRLIQVGAVDSLPTSAEENFQVACTSLYGDVLSDVLAAVTCDVRLYTLVPVGDSGNALNIVARVIGTPIGAEIMRPADLTAILPTVINENSADFIALLTDDFYAEVYYVEAFNPDSEIPPASLPPSPELTAAPSGSPVEAPVEAPVVVPVPETPTVGPTWSAAPSQSSIPTVEPFTGSGSIVLSIKPVGDIWPESSQAAFVEVCSSFFAENLGDIIEDATCSIRLFTLSPIVQEEGRRLRRFLQTNSTHMLEVVTDVSGNVVGETELTAADFNELLVSVMTGNSSDFIQALQAADDFFADIESVEGSDPNDMNSSPTE